ncbi:MAG TPA: hypothetical protein VF546_22910 [Pyrinomonadaceae bacterium]|jgi:hypothetical protein
MAVNILTGLGRRRLVLAGGALSVLAGVIIAEYKLINRPRVLGLETTGQFAPATVNLAAEELVVEGPLVRAPEWLLLSYDGRATETVNVYFDRARLAGETVEEYAERGLSPPAALAPIDYQFDPGAPAASGEPCHTRVEVRADGALPAALHLFQGGTPGRNSYRELWLRATGADLKTRIDTADAPGASARAPGCRKLLKVGDWQQSVAAESVLAVVPADAEFRLRFLPLKTDANAWAEAENFFDLGIEQVRGDDPPPFQARAVSVRRRQGGVDLLRAESAPGDPPLTVQSLRVGSDQLQVSVGGRGFVQRDGDYYKVNLLEPLYTTTFGQLLLALQGALVAWVLRTLGKKSPADAAE